jgi:predicted nucleic acid-binding protein
MIVVADTSPINYLLLIGHVQILPELFRQIVVPPTVLSELQATEAPEEVKVWLTRRPEWLHVQPAKDINASLVGLDEGEQEAISLALEISADLVLIDEAAGRQAALRLGLNITVTLGLLARAAKAGLIDLKTAVERIQQTSFHVSPTVIQALLQHGDKDQ